MIRQRRTMFDNRMRPASPAYIAKERKKYRLPMYRYTDHRMWFYSPWRGTVRTWRLTRRLRKGCRAL